MSEVLCIADGKRVYDVQIEFYDNAFMVKWDSEVGFGTFSLVQTEDGLKLDTEFMGRKFCQDILNYILEIAEVEYKEEGVK